MRGRGCFAPLTALVLREGVPWWSRWSQRGNGVVQTHTAVVTPAGALWIGWIEEVPGASCQERTREELLETLRITLDEALDLNRREARWAAGKGFEDLIGFS